MRRHKRKNRKSRSPVVSYLILIILLGGLVYFVFSQPYFTIAKIEIQGDKLFDASLIREKSQTLLGQNLFFGTFAPIKGYLKTMPYIKKFNFHRRLPDTLIITVAERTPLAVVIDETGQNVIDEDGVVLGSAAPNNQQDLPVIRGISSEAIKNHCLDQKVMQATVQLLSSFTKLLPNHKLQLDLGQSEEINLIVDDVLYVKLGYPEDLDKKIKVFEQLLEAVKGKWQYVEYINVSVPANPAVKFSR